MELDRGAPERPVDQEQKLPLRTHIAISAFWLAVNLHWVALLMIILPSQAERLDQIIGVPKADISGWTLAFGAVIGAIVPPIVGAFSDRCTLRLGRRRPYVIAGTILNIAALFLFYAAFLSRSLPAYIGAWLLIGFGNNIAVGAFHGVIPDLVPAGQRGLASAWMATMQQIGTIGGFVIGALFLSKGREQDLMALTAIAAVVGVITLWTVAGTTERPLERAEPFRWSELKSCFWLSPREHPDFAWVWVTRAFFNIGWNLIQGTLLYFMGDAVGAADPPVAFSILGGVVTFAAIPTGLAGGILSDRIGRKRIVFIAGMVMAATCLLFASVGLFPVGMRLPVVYGIAVLWGCGYGAFSSVDWALGTDVLPNPEDAAKDMGVWHLAWVIPQTIAGPAAAMILRPFVLPGGDQYRVAGYAVLFAVAALFMFLCGALIFRVKKAR